jgi:hypothetical protein
MDNLKENTVGSWWDDPYSSIVEKMTSHWGGRAVSSMGLSPVSSVRSRLDYKSNNLGGLVPFVTWRKGQFFMPELRAVLYFFLQTVRTGGGPNSEHDVQSFFVISGWQTGEFAVIEP